MHASDDGSGGDVVTTPLAGIGVVSLAGQLPGPYAAMLLADLGASVTFVERPDGDPLRMVPRLHAAVVGDRPVVALDLKDPMGRDAALDLCARADVVLEGFRPGVAARLGVGPADVHALDPTVIYVSMSGFGQRGPYAHRPAHDIVYQAVAGSLHEELLAGEPDTPRTPFVPWADMSGALFGVIGALSGLWARAARGNGHVVDVSLTDSLVATLGPVIAARGREGAGQLLPPTPGYGVHWTADGVPVALGVVHEDHLWERLCRAVGRTDLVGPDIAGRWADHGRLDAAVRAAVRAAPWKELQGRLEAEDVPFARANRLEEVVTDPHVVARGLVHGRGGRVVVRQPLQFGGTAPGTGA